MKFKTILLLLIGITCLVVAMVYLPPRERRKDMVTATIKDKITKQYPSAIYPFVIYTNYAYYFIMDNGDEVLISYSDYEEYSIGELYTYEKQEEITN